MLTRLRQFHIRSLVAVTAIAAFLLAVSRPVDEPSIAAAESSIDIGAVAAGTSGTCRFTLENSGRESIRVRSGGTGGTAKIVGPHDYTIPTNSQQEILIRWTLRSAAARSKGHAKDKPLRWTYRLFTNDPKNPVIDLSITGRSI